MFVYLKKNSTFAVPKRDDSLAQQVEHNTFNVGVLGSSPRRITKKAAQKAAFFVEWGYWRHWEALGGAGRCRVVPGGEAEAASEGVSEAATEGVSKAAFVHKQGCFCGCRVIEGGFCPQKRYLLWMKVSRNCREAPEVRRRRHLSTNRGIFVDAERKLQPPVHTEGTWCGRNIILCIFATV